MDRMMYVAMAGAKQVMLAQAVNNNNLANVSTTGFRSDLAVFQDLQVYGPGQPSRVYTEAQQTGIDTRQGAIITTGNELDVALNGEGWIAVQGVDGKEAYTRAGSFRVNANGQLETGNGRPVLGNGGPISLPPYEKVEIAGDGTISVRPVGQAASTLAVVDRIKLVNPPATTLVKGDDGLMRLRSTGAADADAKVKLVSGATEGSNVNAIEAMVRMIDLARQYEMQVKMMHTAQRNDETAQQLLRMA